MSVASPSQPGATGTPGAAGSASAAPLPAGEACPLCGAPLHPEQEWCLSCGAAARTRLAASPRWRAPIVTIAAVLVIALGVLAGSLVKLAGGSGTPLTQTTTVTTAQAPGAAPQATVAPTTSAAPATPATTPSASAAQPGATGATTSATPSAGGTGSQATRAKARNRYGINLTHLKKSVAERLRKLGLGPSTEQ